MGPCPAEYSRAALTAVPALTLLNPWALAITRWGKSPENRSWAPPSNVARLLIHSGKGDDDDGFDYLLTLGYTEAAMDSAVRSAIVSIADLTGVCIPGRGKCRCPARWAVAGQVHWKLDNVVPLPVPVRVGGRLRLWHPDAGTLDAVAASLALLQFEPLVCTGRRVDGQGRAVGMPCGVQFHPERGDTYDVMELRARVAGWKVAPGPADGGLPDAMCTACANPSKQDRDLLNSLRRYG